MMRSPPRVSSTWLMVSLHNAWTLMLLALSLRPTTPMNHPKRGTKQRVKRVSFHEMKSRAQK